MKYLSQSDRIAIKSQLLNYLKDRERAERALDRCFEREEIEKADYFEAECRTANISLTAISILLDGIGITYKERKNEKNRIVDVDVFLK